MAAKILHQYCILVLSIALVSCGGGKSSATVVPPTGTLVTGLQIPSFPHQIDVYSTPAATRAIVFLHGATGHNYSFAFDLGLNLNGNTTPPTPATVNWPWLDANKVLAVFPQGQALDGYPLATTWSNHVMDSGVNDLAFLQALAAYIKSAYPNITRIYLAGHSNGGMMANRFWCESPGTFDGYVAMSGPASGYYLNALTPCTPSTFKPYYGIVGGQDSILQVPQNGGLTGATWTIDPVLFPVNGTTMLDGTLIGERWQQSNTRLPLCGSSGVAFGPPVSVGDSDIWSNCSGLLKLQEVLPSEHYVISLQLYSGSQLIDLIADFINVINVP